jgi:hypothetical protein
MNTKTCECPYKERCHSIRQELQIELREKNKSTIEKCPFYRVLKNFIETNHNM